MTVFVDNRVFTSDLYRGLYGNQKFEGGAEAAITLSQTGLQR